MSTVSVTALAGHQFLRGMPRAQLAQLAGVASLVTVPAQHRFFDVGGVARHFWLIRAGQVLLDAAVPGNGRVVLGALGRGEVVGLSWFLPPFRWEFGALARQPTEAFQLDGEEVRLRCEKDPELGYQVTRRLAAVAIGRLQVARTRLLEARGGQL